MTPTSHHGGSGSGSVWILTMKTTTTPIHSAQISTPHRRQSRSMRGPPLTIKWTTTEGGPRNTVLNHPWPSLPKKVLFTTGAPADPPLVSQISQHHPWAYLAPPASGFPPLLHQPLSLTCANSASSKPSSSTRIWHSKWPNIWTLRTLFPFTPSARTSTSLPTPASRPWSSGKALEKQQSPVGRSFSNVTKTSARSTPPLVPMRVSSLAPGKAALWRMLQASPVLRRSRTKASAASPPSAGSAWFSIANRSSEASSVA